MKHIKYEEYRDAGIAGSQCACPRRQHRFPTDRQTVQCDTVYFSSSEPQLYLASSLPIYLQTSSGLVLPSLSLVESRSVLVFVLKISSLVQVADLVGQVGRFTSVFLRRVNYTTSPYYSRFEGGTSVQWRKLTQF